MASKQVASRVRVDMLFDIISPYAYIQFELLRRNRANWPTMDLHFKPVLLSGIIVGAKNVPPFRCEPKSIYILEDLKNLSETFQIPLIMPENFFAKALANSTLLTQRYLVAIQPHITPELFEKFVLCLYEKHFSEGSIDLTNADLNYQLAVESGIDSEIAKLALERTASEEVKNALKAANEQALKEGVFGIPTTFIYTENGKKMVWGSDRMSVIGRLLGEKSPPVWYKA